MEQIALNILDYAPILYGGFIVIAVMIGLSPTRPGPNDGTFEALQKTFRFFNNAMLAAFPMIIGLSIFAVSRLIKIDALMLYSALWDSTKSLLMPFTGALLIAITAKISWSRYGIPAVSSLKNKISNSEKMDQLDDILQMDSRAPGIKDPRKHFRDGLIYLGDCWHSNKPEYMDIDDWRGTNILVVGGTRKGKGVLSCGALYQQILQGDTVIAIDPKPDQFQGALLKQAAIEAGREDEFMYVDLVNNINGYGPFIDGSKYQRRDRMYAAFNLHESGTNADHYKLNDRIRVDDIMNNDGLLTGHLASIHMKAVRQRLDDGKEESDLDKQIMQWLRPSLCATNEHKKASTEGTFIPSKVIKKGGIVYIRSSLNDPVIKRATIAMITNIISAATTNAENRPHVTLSIDESRVLVSEPVVTALATCLGANMNMLLQQQAITDSRALNPDPRLTSDVAYQSIITNTQLKILYGGLDADTAEYIEKHTGLTTKNVLERDHFESKGLGKKRTGDTMASAKQEALITASRVLTLPDRVGVRLSSKALPSIINTYWVPVETELEGFTRNEVPQGAVPDFILNYEFNHIRKKQNEDGQKGKTSAKKPKKKTPVKKKTPDQQKPKANKPQAIVSDH